MAFIVKCIVLCMLPVGIFLQKEGSDSQFTEAVIDNGYPIETHQVETYDGYILTVFRIPHGKNTNRTNPYPVLLNHGMFGSAENYILLGPKKSLGFVLADSRYDVWLMNCRGTWHSRKHRTLKPSQREFWQFSWHEIGIYDIPAVIDYILSNTNQTALQYVGHSQGSTSLFVMGSERPEYNSKIKLMVALAPGAIYSHFKNPMLLMAVSYLNVIENLAESLQIYELPPSFMSAAELRTAFKLLCVESDQLKNTCSGLFKLFTESTLFNEKSLSKILPMSLASCSTRQALHYAQQIKSGNFQKYDYGPDKNMEKYGTRYPPLYDLKNITFPVALFFGDGDNLVTEEDVKLLASKLPNLAALFRIPSKNFTHIDFIFADNLDKVLNIPVLKIMRKYRKN